MTKNQRADLKLINDYNESMTQKCEACGKDTSNRQYCENCGRDMSLVFDELDIKRITRTRGKDWIIKQLET